PRSVPARSTTRRTGTRHVGGSRRRYSLVGGRERPHTSGSQHQGPRHTARLAPYRSGLVGSASRPFRTPSATPDGRERAHNARSGVLSPPGRSGLDVLGATEQIGSYGAVGC